MVWEYYKPIIRVWLWLAYKVTKNDCRLRIFIPFIQTKKLYPSFLEEKSILSWKLFTISSQNFSCELNSSRTYSLQNISHLSQRLELLHPMLYHIAQRHCVKCVQIRSFFCIWKIRTRKNSIFGLFSRSVG